MDIINQIELNRVRDKTDETSTQHFIKFPVDGGMGGKADQSTRGAGARARNVPAAVTLSNVTCVYNTSCPRCGNACAWTVPSGTKQVIFEIWGPGGHGLHARCCTSHPGGRTGAYGRKCVQVSGGEIYDVCAGCALCCSHAERSYKSGDSCVSGGSGDTAVAARVQGGIAIRQCVCSDRSAVTAFDTWVNNSCCNTAYGNGNTNDGNGIASCETTPYYNYTSLSSGGVCDQSLIMRANCQYVGVDWGMNGSHYIKLHHCTRGPFRIFPAPMTSYWLNGESCCICVECGTSCNTTTGWYWPGGGGSPMMHCGDGCQNNCQVVGGGLVKIWYE